MVFNNAQNFVIPSSKDIKSIAVITTGLPEDVTYEKPVDQKAGSSESSTTPHVPGSQWEGT